MTAAFGVGQMVGPALASIIIDLTGAFKQSSLFAVSALVIAGIFVITVRHNNGPSDKPQTRII